MWCLIDHTQGACSGGCACASMCDQGVLISSAHLRNAGLSAAVFCLTLAFRYVLVYPKSDNSPVQGCTAQVAARGYGA
jgi:hypothetical protein